MTNAAMVRKIGELRTRSAVLLIYHDSHDGVMNRYKIVRKWYDGGWHQKTEIKYADLFSVTNWINEYVRVYG